MLRMKSSSLIFCLLTTAIFMFMVVSSAMAIVPRDPAAHYVATTGDNSANNCRTQGSPCRTITYALGNASVDGDVVNVALGIYSSNETYPLQPSDGVTLSGAGADTTFIHGGVDWSPLISYQSVLSNPAMTILEGFTIDNTATNGYGVTIQTSSAVNVSPVIRNNNISGNYYGINLNATSGGTISPTIENNEISGNNSGVYSYEYLSTLSPDISGNIISANTTSGVLLAGNSPSSFTLSRNIITSNGYGLMVQSFITLADVDAGTAGSGTGFNTITSNTTYDVSRSVNVLGGTMMAENNWWGASSSVYNTSGTIDMTPAADDTLSFTVSPASGIYTGDTPVVITAASGTFFVDKVGVNQPSNTNYRIKVTFGGASATDIVVNSNGTQVALKTPAGTLDDVVDVVVTNPGGQTGTKAAAFTYAESDPVAASGSSGGGCFIATAAYGSYMADDVMVLRKFRDEQLLTSTMGTAFVNAYYKYSPPVADYIAGNETLRTVTRWGLSPLVYGAKYPIAAMGIFTLLLLGISSLFIRKRQDS